MAETAGENIAMDPDFEYDNPLFNSGELHLIADLERKLGIEAARLGGDLILELKKVEEEHGRSQEITQ